MLRFILKVLFIILLVSFIKGNVKLTTRRDIRLSSSYVIKSISNSNIETCLEHCLKDCSCVSFQLCKPSMCQLLSTTLADLNISRNFSCKFCEYFDFKFSYDHDKVSTLSMIFILFILVMHVKFYYLVLRKKIYFDYVRCRSCLNLLFKTFLQITL